MKQRAAPKPKMKPLGKHLIVELIGCDVGKINKVRHVRRAMIEAAKRAKTTIVRVVFHSFSPYGVSGVVVIAESHLSIHTWPEQQYAAVDLFTCGKTTAPSIAARYLKKAFGAQEVRTRMLRRPIPLRRKRRLPR